MVLPPQRGSLSILLYHVSLAKPRWSDFRSLSSSSTRWQPPSPGPSSDHAPRNPLQQLRDLRRLLNEVGTSNRPIYKTDALQRTPWLWGLLFTVYEPDTRFRMSSAALSAYLELRKKDNAWQADPSLPTASLARRGKQKTFDAASRDLLLMNAPHFDSVEDLLSALRDGVATGMQAKAMCERFLKEHGILEEERRIWERGQGAAGEDSVGESIARLSLLPTPLELFYRLIDRNLKAGFNYKLLRSAFERSRQFDEEFGRVARLKSASSSTASGSKAVSSTKCSATSTGIFSMPKPFEIALGKTIKRSEVDSLFAARPKASSTLSAGTGDWYASRKLDGIRCLVFIDIPLAVIQEENGPVDADVQIRTLSRSGKEFVSLDRLKEALLVLVHSPAIKRLASMSAKQTEELGGDKSPLPDCARIVLDGEVCSLVPAGTSAKQTVGAVPSTQDTAFEAENEQIEFVEDFRSIASLVMRRSGEQIPSPAYFVLDALTYPEFAQWEDFDSRGGTRSFKERREIVEGIHDWIAMEEGRQVGSLDREKGAAVKAKKLSEVVRRLEQKLVKSPHECLQAMGEACTKGWEGIVLRRDVGHEGKRSSNIRKFKEWNDAEYVVKSIESSRQRLAVNGVYEDREALANVWIEHKGHPVAVGSGFTTDQRLRYHADPSLIVGKQITVEYFEESESKERLASLASADGDNGEGPALSLRFPRVKHVYEEGEREI